MVFRIAEIAMFEQIRTTVAAKPIPIAFESFVDENEWEMIYVSAATGEGIKDMIHRVSERLQLLPPITVYESETENEAELDFFSTNFGKVLRGHFKDTIDYYLSAANAACADKS